MAAGVTLLVSPGGDDRVRPDADRRPDAALLRHRSRGADGRLAARHAADRSAAAAAARAAGRALAVGRPARLRRIQPAAGPVGRRRRRGQDPDLFAPPDLPALAGPYGPWLIATAQDGLATGLAGYVDDDLAFVAPWGFRLADVAAPVLLVHGGLDRMAPSAHSAWLASHLPVAELGLRPADGHLSIFTAAALAVGRLR
jgi:pimeloyl-ACP methyl ester carboxylesterase